jgi:hypothetical protein
MLIASGAPGCCICNWTGSASRSGFTTCGTSSCSINGGKPLIVTMLSPGRNPAFCAGLPGSTPRIKSGGEACANWLGYKER